MGKSSLLVRFADNHFSGNYITTIGKYFCQWQWVTFRHWDSIEMYIFSFLPFYLCSVQSQSILLTTIIVFRGGLQDSHNRAARGEGEAADLGHGGPGALPHHHQHLLPRHARRHRRLRRHQRRELRQCEALAARDRPELRGGQQDPGRQQE